MKNYIEDGLLMRKAPILIYKEIYQRLQFGDLTKRERKELEKQLAKAKKMVDKTADIFGRFTVTINMPYAEDKNNVTHNTINRQE